MTSRTLSLDEAVAIPSGHPRRVMAVRNALLLEAGESVLEARPGYLRLRVLKQDRVRRIRARLAVQGWTARITHADPVADCADPWIVEAFE